MVQAELDTHDPKASQLKLNFLKKRSKVSFCNLFRFNCTSYYEYIYTPIFFQIMEITAAKDIIFALASSGVCVAYARGVKGDSLSSLPSFFCLEVFL